MGVFRFFSGEHPLAFYRSSFSGEVPIRDVEGWKQRQGTMPAKAMNRHKVPTDRDTLKRTLFLWAAYALGVVTVALLILIFGGEAFRPARRAVRIDWIVGDSRGVYADCGKVGNGLNRYCRKSYENNFRRTVTEPSRFRRPTHDVPFSLSGTD